MAHETINLKHLSAPACSLVYHKIAQQNIASVAELCAQRNRNIIELYPQFISRYVFHLSVFFCRMCTSIPWHFHGVGGAKC